MFFAEFPATFCGFISASDPDPTFQEVLDSDPTPEQGRVKTEKKILLQGIVYEQGCGK